MQYEPPRSLATKTSSVERHDPLPPPPPVVDPVHSTPAVSVTAPAAPLPWLSRLREFYASYAGGPSARSAAYARLFAARLQRFIGQRDVSRSAAIAAAERFFADKSDVAYRLRSEPSVEALTEGQRVRFELEARWALAAPAETAGDARAADTREMVELRLFVELETDASGSVISYVERPRTRHFKVGGDRDEAARGFDLPASRCDDGYERGGVALKRGTIVEDTGHFIELPMCGPGPQISRRVRYDGDELWVDESSYSLVPNPHGGSSLGSQDFLVRTD